MLRESYILGHNTSGQELETYRDLNRRLLPVGMEMKIEMDFGAGANQAAFDPNYSSMTLRDFAPIVRRTLSVRRR